MKKFLLLLVFTVTFIVRSQYMVNGLMYCDYYLNGDEYQGVYYEDMMDDLNNACAVDAGYVEPEE